MFQDSKARFLDIIYPCLIFTQWLAQAQLVGNPFYIHLFITTACNVIRQQFVHDRIKKVSCNCHWEGHIDESGVLIGPVIVLRVLYHDSRFARLVIANDGLRAMGGARSRPHANQALLRPQIVPNKLPLMTWWGTKEWNNSRASLHGTLRRGGANDWGKESEKKKMT